MWMTIALIVGGLIVLAIGAEALVRGASRLAEGFGISPLVIGLTIVAFGTSSPELAVSLQSALSGKTDLAVGNVVGSNILNVLLILGLSAIITPLAVSQHLIRVDVPLMVGVSFLMWGMALDGTISQLDGVVLFALMLAYIGFLLWEAHREKEEEVKAEYAQAYTSNEPKTGSRRVINIVLAVAGLVMLVVGSRLFVTGATDLARAFGMSELVIGLTVVAIGTSMPEIAASLTAAFRGERDIAVGNVVGSNIFNLLLVLGLTSMIAGGGLPVAPGALTLDIPFMVAVAVATLPIFFTRSSISRWEGAVFFGYYIAYTVYLLLNGANHPRTTQYLEFMTIFVIPLTAMTLGISVYREVRRRRRAAASPAPGETIAG